MIARSKSELIIVKWEIQSDFSESLFNMFNEESDRDSGEYQKIYIYWLSTN